MKSRISKDDRINKRITKIKALIKVTLYTNLTMGPYIVILTREGMKMNSILKKMFSRNYLIILTLAFCMAATQATADNLTYTYDNAGRLTKVDYGNNKTITFTYNKAGNITQKIISTALPLWVDFTYTGTESGTEALPFNTLAEAVNAATSGGEIIIKDCASISEPITINKNVIIKCGGAN